MLSFFLLLSFTFVIAHPLHKRTLATVYSSCAKDKDVALTFDDGPYIYLEKISDALSKAGAKGTFFFNGNNYDCIYDSDVVSRVKYAFAAGHQLSSHTWAHADLTTLNSDQINDAMYRMEQALEQIVGVKPAFMRPPYGYYNDNIRSIAAARGQALALWDFDAGDADGNTTAQSEAVYKNAVNKHVKNMLALNHETEETTANTLVPYAINLLQSNGYNLVTLADCLGVQPYQQVGSPSQPNSIWTCNGTPTPGKGCTGSQCETGTPPFSGNGTTPPPPVSHQIHPGKSASTCLTASSNANGAAVVVEPCNKFAGQNWVQSGNTFTVFGNKCLDVTNGSTANGTKMQIYSCSTGDKNQQFTVTSQSQITWTNKNECLDLTDGSITNGNRVQMWKCSNGNSNQVWHIV